ncbi:MAG: ATP--guanido phosphotransferase [Christensenellales bacterium]|jgi:protein arginine kinase
MTEFENIIISSRVRLARNFKDVNFPAKMNDEFEAISITKGLFEVLNKFADFDFYKLKNLTNIKMLTFLEQNHISKELIDNKDISVLALSEKDGISVMINEEDHIRMQCILPGLELQEAFDRINRLDDLILENFDIAYDDEFGFITFSPTNLGTGMRASVMLFLPALTMFGKLETLANSAAKLGLTVRGKHGEHSSGEGFMYQISNEATLGVSEEEILQNVINVTLKICEMEADLLKQLYEEKQDEITQAVLRALGILLYSHYITYDEALKNLSLVKLGINLGIIKMKNFKIIDDLFVKVQPAHLMELSASDMSQFERDKYRAKYLKLALKDNI